MVTAPEIIFFWVARMIMMGYEFQGEPPFREVYLTGTVRDMKGRKMSKSLGNGIDPLEVVRAYGADAMRYTIISQCAIGTDINLDHENLEAAFSSGRNFANKIWNAGRFALMSLGDAPVSRVRDVAEHLELEDIWIISRLQRAADIIVAPWPQPEEAFISEEAEQLMAGLQELVVEVRRLRKEYGIAEGKRVAIHVTGGDAAFMSVVREKAAAFEQLARVARIETTAGVGVGAHAVLNSGADLFLPLADVIDVEREHERLSDEITRLDQLLAGTRKKLENESFVARAPAEVVQKERDRTIQLEEQGSKLREKLAGLEAGGT
jgi:valyl-tRNA synthetase